MKKIEIIQKENVTAYIQSLWKSEIFRESHFFIDLIVKEVSRAPLFFYEASHEREKLQLSALYRHIMHRDYNNDYIHDLYYFHELVHIATLSYTSPNFSHWREKLSENELIASLYSEAFIYYFLPQLLNKTFDNLWVKRFMDDTRINEIGLPLHKEKDKNFQIGNFFSLELHNWPFKFQQIIQDRRRLRQANVAQDKEEEWIIKYNGVREKWLNKWQPYYKDIDTTMQHFLQLSTHSPQLAIADLQSFLNKHSCDNIPFFSIIEAKT